MGDQQTGQAPDSIVGQWLEDDGERLRVVRVLGRLIIAQAKDGGRKRAYVAPQGWEPGRELKRIIWRVK